MSNIIKTLFYTSLPTFLVLVALELARPGFVTHFINIPLFFLIPLVSGVGLVLKKA